MYLVKKLVEKSFLYLDAQLLHELGIYEWDRQLNCKK